MKIKVYETDEGFATYKVGDKYYGFLDPAPRSQEEFNKALHPDCRQQLVNGEFMPHKLPELIELKFVCEVEA